MGHSVGNPTHRRLDARRRARRSSCIRTISWNLFPLLAESRRPRPPEENNVGLFRRKQHRPLSAHTKSAPRSHREGHYAALRRRPMVDCIEAERSRSTACQACPERLGRRHIRQTPLKEIWGGAAAAPSPLPHAATHLQDLCGYCATCYYAANSALAAPFCTPRCPFLESLALIPMCLSSLLPPARSRWTSKEAERLDTVQAAPGQPF